ncbi:unnamed protein product, partial [Anisakis simplex]|uniref:Serine/threonine-protein kinase n=1 Tax=Anisakis simplex TaxID=6269 RepID=A0A0M3JN73_ANISI
QLNETETNSVSRAAEPVSVTSNAIATQQQQQREEEPNRMPVVVKQEVVEEAEQEDQGTGKISVQPLGAANTLAVSRNTDDAVAGNPAKRHQANEPTIAVTTTTPRIPSKQLESQTAGAAAVFDNSSPLAPLSSSSSMVNDELATEREHHQEQQQQQQKVVPSKKENKMKSVRERYKLAKEQYSDVMKRLDKHR